MCSPPAWRLKCSELSKAVAAQYITCTPLFAQTPATGATAGTQPVIVPISDGIHMHKVRWCGAIWCGAIGCFWCGGVVCVGCHTCPRHSTQFLSMQLRGCPAAAGAAAYRCYFRVFLHNPCRPAAARVTRSGSAHRSRPVARASWPSCRCGLYGRIHRGVGHRLGHQIFVLAPAEPRWRQRPLFAVPTAGTSDAKAQQCHNTAALLLHAVPQAAFADNEYPNTATKAALAEEVGLEAAQVGTTFIYTSTGSHCCNAALQDWSWYTRLLHGGRTSHDGRGSCSLQDSTPGSPVFSIVRSRTPVDAAMAVHVHAPFRVLYRHSHVACSVCSAGQQAV